MSFSRILAKKGRRLIGWKEERMSGGLLGLGTRIIVANFQSIGKYDNLRVALNIIIIQLLFSVGIWQP